MNAACESFLRGGSLNVRRLRQVLSQCLAAFIEAEPEWADKTLPSRTYLNPQENVFYHPSKSKYVGSVTGEP